MKKSKVYIGIIDTNSKGEFFIESNQINHTVYLKEPSLKYFYNDHVEFYINKRKRKGRYLGEIIRLVKREKNEYVGTLQKNKGFAFLIIDDKKIHVDIFIPKEEINNAENGDKVLVEILEWKRNDISPTGRIKEILGKPGEHETEIKSILKNSNFSLDFPKEG